MLKKIFLRFQKKKHNPSRENLYVPNEVIYDRTLAIVNGWLDTEEDVGNKINLLEFVMSCIKKDLQYDTLTTILYEKEHFNKWLPPSFFPYYYFDKKGEILAEYVDIEVLFKHLDTDGVKWINAHAKEPYEEVLDSRFAVLYELARMKFNLKNAEDTLK